MPAEVRMFLAYLHPLPGDVSRLSTDTLRRHAWLASEYGPAGADRDYLAELSRREADTERRAA
jgi:hypothetical protein